MLNEINNELIETIGVNYMNKLFKRRFEIKKGGRREFAIEAKIQSINKI